MKCKCVSKRNVNCVIGVLSKFQGIFWNIISNKSVVFLRMRLTAFIIVHFQFSNSISNNQTLHWLHSRLHVCITIRKGAIHFLFQKPIQHEQRHFMKFSQHVVDNLFSMIMCNLESKGWFLTRDIWLIATIKQCGGLHAPHVRPRVPLCRADTPRLS